MRIRKLLVVHTSRSVRAGLEKIILADGVDIEVSQAESGAEATRHVQNEWIDLVLTDVDLTDLKPDRIKLTFQTSSQNKNLAVVGIASGDSPEEVGAMTANGFEHFVVPPYDPEVLNHIINTVCNPRQWRKAERYHFPDSHVTISVWGMEAEARLINLSLGGVLLEAAGDRSELFLQNNPKLTIKIKIPTGYCNIDNIPAKLERLNAIEWNTDYKPSVMRIVYIFLEMDPTSRDRLEEILLDAAEKGMQVDVD